MKIPLQSFDVIFSVLIQILDFKKQFVDKVSNIKIYKPFLLLFFLVFLFGNSQTTTAFSYTGANQTFTVPAGVNSINVKMWGAGGASSFYGPSAGGSGAFVKGTLAVTPGQSLIVVVGQGGIYFSTNTGYGGGGPSGDFGGAGGGFSGIFLTSVTQGNAKAIAGGGGGGGAYGQGTFGGGGGATTGSDGPIQSAMWQGGKGGSLSAGGAGGIVQNANGTAGSSGGILAGGSGGINTYVGGGGGGGYFGGGGGYGSNTTNRYSTGGGGGSSLISPLTSVTNTAGTTSGVATTSPQAPGNSELEYVAGIGNGGNSTSSPGTVNGGNGRVVFTYTSCTAPTTQATIGAYTNNTAGTGLTVNWTRGNGNNVIVVGRLTATTLVNPTSGTTYTANSAFGSGSTTGTGNFVVYNGPLATVNVTGLTNNSNYTFTIYEYNTTGTCYKVPGSASAVTATLVVAAPTITSFTPVNACASSGSTVVITGTGFTGASAVTFGGTAATAFTVNSATQITATVGAGTTGKIAVTTAGGTVTSTGDFTVNPLPVISSQPLATNICTTGSGTFTVASNATTFQWRRNTVPLTNTGIYSGVNTPTLTITNPAVGDAGNFDVIISNASSCTVTSTARALTVTTIPAAASTPIPTSGATGVCYAGTGAISSISWGAVAGATSYDVYFGAGSVPATLTSNVLTNSYNTGILTANTTYQWRIVAKNGCGNALSSTTWNFTTSASACYCIPSVGNGYQSLNYINNVAIRGTLVEAENFNTSYSSSPRGYQDFTAKLPRAKQTQGGAVNVVMESTRETLYKAWVDYDNNGSFEDPGEKVYDAGTTSQLSTTFGFIIPANQPPGLYRIRIRISDGGPFTSCNNLNENGETEDYLMEVVANCWSIINNITDNIGCAGNSLDLKANASGTVVEYRWYDAQTGGNLKGTSLPVSTTDNSTTWTTPVLSTSTVFYVEAWSGSCSSLVRVPVKAFIKPIPLINFNLPSATACGDNSIITLSALGNNQTRWLINDNFEKNATDLGDFIAGRENNIDGGVLDTKSKWTNRESVFVANAGVSWTPAISSGAQSDNFVMTTSDLGNKYNVNTTLTSVAKNTVGFTSLQLKFKMYYSRYQPDGIELAKDFVKVQASINGTTWDDIDVITKDIGTATNFEYPIQTPTNSYDLSSYIGNPNFQIRILYHADDWCDGVAIDDVELYGVEPLKTSFTWTSSNPINFYSNAAATIPYAANTEATVVYIKPDETQIAEYNDWNITATVNLTNGCPAVGSFNLINDTKVWMPSNSLITNWNDPNIWKPNPSIPTIDKCVVIRKPVEISAATNAFAKSIKIEKASGTTGKLTINGSLTVADGIKNTGAASDFLVASDANLVQINDNSDNSTGLGTAQSNIAVRRNHTLTGSRKEYNYLSSPVAEQNMKMIFGNNAANVQYVTVLNEATNYFVNATAANYLEKGKGFAVKEPRLAGYVDSSGEGLANDVAQYKGVINNGVIDIPLARTSSSKGYNVVGNPYPSNIDIKKLYANSVSNFTTPEISADFRFWDNKVNATYVQMGGTYQGYSYAIYNAISDASTAAPGLDPTGVSGIGTKAPSKIIKVSQAFMVRALQNAASMKFKNEMREVAQGTSYYGKGETPDNRYRLQLRTSANFVLQNAITYIPIGNNGFGFEDTRIPNSSASDALFSYADDAKVVINGRGNFMIDDVVILGLRHFTAGTYKIQAVDKEGVFANDQAIYLKDKELGIITDLTAGDYTFTSASGEYTNRFEIVYKPGAVLTTDGSMKSSLEVYRDAADFVVHSSTKAIDSIELYDASGKLIFTLNGNNRKDLRFNAEKLVNGMYVLKAMMKGGEPLTKKIRK